MARAPRAGKEGEVRPRIARLLRAIFGAYNHRYEYQKEENEEKPSSVPKRPETNKNACSWLQTPPKGSKLIPMDAMTSKRRKRWSRTETLVPMGTEGSVKPECENAG